MATKSTENQSVLNAVICELCSESYTDPRMLPCLHSFCRECLEKEAEKAGSQETLHCQTCKKNISLLKGGVSDLPRNLRLSFNVETAGYQARLTSGSAISCDSCVDSTSGSAVAFCTDCCEFLCKLCREFHRRSKRTLKHEVHEISEKKRTNFTQNMKPREFYCIEPKHENEVLKFYCKTCDQLICRDCVLIKHKAHEHTDLSEIAKEQRGEMKSLLEPASEAMVTLDDAMGSSDKMMQRVQSRSKLVDDSLENVFGQLHDAIEKRKSELLAKRKEITIAKETALVLQKEEFHSMKKEIAKFVDTITDVLQTHTDEEVVGLRRLLQVELTGVLGRFQSFSLGLSESDVMPTVLEPSSLLQSIAEFGAVSGGCSPSHSMVELSIPRAIKGRERKLFVTAREENDQCFEYGGENVSGELQLMGADCPPVKGKTVDNKDGTYSVSFTPQDIGEHKLSITICNKPIKGSPFVLYVRELRDYTTLQSPQQTMSNFDGNNVYALSFHENGNMYVTQNHYVQILKPDGSTVTRFGSNGRGEGQFSHPYGVAVWGDSVYVCGNSNHRVQKFSTSGTFVSKFGEKGSREGQFRSPRGICLDNKGNIYVAEHGNNRIQVFQADGTFIRIIQPSDGNIQNPWGITHDSSGNLHVACYGSNTIKVFTREGKFLEEYGQGQLTYPASVAVDEEGYSFVVEYNTTRSRLQIFNPSHTLVKSLSGFNNPFDVNLSKEGFIFVCDYSNSRILKY